MDIITTVRRRTPVFLLALLLGAPPTVAAQPASDAPSGLWWSAGVGAGSLHFECSICQRGRDTGATVDVALGAWARPSLRVGLAGGFWTFDDEGVREMQYRGGLIALYYPSPDRGLHLIGGVGWTAWRAEDFNYDAMRVEVGAGWDLAMTGSWSVGNALLLEGSAFGDLKNEDRPVVESTGMSSIRFVVYLKHR